MLVQEKKRNIVEFGAKEISYVHTDDVKVFDLSRTNTGAKLLVFKTSSYVIIEETIIVVW